MIAHLIHMRAQLGRSMPFPLCSFGRGGPVYMSTRSFFLLAVREEGRLEIATYTTAVSFFLPLSTRLTGPYICPV